MLFTARPQVSLLSCGLGGQVQLQALITGVNSCRGTLTDWNPFKCSIVSTLTLDLTECKHGETEIYRGTTCQLLLYSFVFDCHTITEKNFIYIFKILTMTLLFLILS